MTRKQLRKREKKRAMVLFSMKKISRLEYGQVLRGRGWFYCNELRTVSWCTVRHQWVDMWRQIET